LILIRGDRFVLGDEGAIAVCLFVWGRSLLWWGDELAITS
jgi:hypothetical protein